MDFSQFHDLEHPWFSAYCYSQYGGPKHHIKLWWDYKFDYHPYQIVGRIKCKFNRHTPQGYWTGLFTKETYDPKNMPPYDGYSCEFCGIKLNDEKRITRNIR